MNELIKHSKKLIEYADTIIEMAKAHDDNLREIIIAGLFSKILSGAKSISLLCEKGFSVEAEIIARSILEAYFYMGACSNSDDALYEYINKHLLDKRRYIRKVLEHPELFGEETKSYSDDDIDNIEKEIKGKSINGLSAKKASQYANVYDLYIIYMLYSDSVHSNPKHLEDTYMEHNEIVITQINIGRNFKRVKEALTLLNIVLAISLRLYRNMFGIKSNPEIDEILEVYIKEYSLNIL